MRDEADLQKEAERWFYALEGVESLASLVMFGIGSGYYYDAAKEWLRADPSRYLIFLEPDLPGLRSFLETEKGQTVSNDPQVIVVSVEIPADGVVQIENYEWKWIAALLLNGSCLFSASPIYEKTYREFWDKLKRSFQYYLRAFAWECSFFLPEFVRSTQSNTAKNLFQLSGSRLFYDIEKSLEGIPAIICGAGPSIEKDLPLLKLYQDRALIFGAGTGMNVLNEYNIPAHIGVGIDPDIASASRIMSNRAYETPYCITLKFNHDALQWVHGSKLYFRGQDLYGIDSWFEKALGLDRFPRIDYRISTTHTSLLIAQMMGCNPIILLGIDLSYSDLRKYPSKISPHPCDRLDISRQQLEGPNSQERIELVGEGGEAYVTRADWIREAQEYGQFAHEHPELKIINATARGLPIPGLKREPFQCVAEKWLHKKEEIQERLGKAISKARILEYPVSAIREKIALWLEKLQEGEEWLRKLENGERREWERFANTDAYRHFLQTIDHYYEIFFFSDRFQYKYRSEKLSMEAKIEKGRSFERERIRYLRTYLLTVQKLYQLCLHVESPPTVAENPTPVKKGNTCYYYYLDGQLKSSIPHTSDGLLDGCVALYYPDGSPKREVRFKKGALDGIERCWDAKGALIFECEHPKHHVQGAIKRIKTMLKNYE